MDIRGADSSAFALTWLRNLLGWRDVFDTLGEALWDEFGIDPYSRALMIYDRVRTINNVMARKYLIDALKILREMRREWKGYDYGHGYFYQSNADAMISGRRCTAARLRSMRLRDRVSGKTVLDIGSNTGFVALALAPFSKRIIGVEPNPFYNEIARNYAEYFNVNNIEFIAERLESFDPKYKFEVLLSLSNHFTYDGPILHSESNYFAQCTKFIGPGGTIIVESHTPNFEQRGGGFEALKKAIAASFKIVEEGSIEGGKALDRGRRYYVGRLP